MPRLENTKLPNLHNLNPENPSSKRNQVISLLLNDASDTVIDEMKSRSRSHSHSPRNLVQLRAWKLDTLIESPKIAFDVLEPSMNMAQLNGLINDSTSPNRQRTGSIRGGVSPVVRTGGLLSRTDTPTSPEPPVWSSAVGHASTGKSGRVIERLQADIDRLHREKQLLKVRYEESEKTNETIQTRNQYLQDRNSNYEQSHEANLRQLARKERQVEELREELKREKQRTASAEQRAQAAATSEEEWREQANQAKSNAAQKEMEYETIVTCRKLDQERNQGGLEKVRENFEILLRDRQSDLETYRKLEILAEQQKQTIEQLEELTRRLNANFRSYRNEIDTAIAGMREHVSSNDSAVAAKLDDMTRVTSKMRWLMNVEQEINRKGSKEV